MVKEKAMNGKLKYPILLNIVYVFRKTMHWDKKYYIAFFTQIPAEVILPLAAVYFPKLLLDLLVKEKSNNIILLTIFVYTAFIIGMEFIRQLCLWYKDTKKYHFMFRFQELKALKFITTDYENIENPKFQDLGEKASWGQEGQKIISSIGDFMVAVLGIVIYGTIIATLSPFILIILVITTFFNYLLLKYKRNYSNKVVLENVAPIQRKIEYLQNLSFRFEQAKDIRLYKIGDWFKQMLDVCNNEIFVWAKKESLKELLITIIGALLNLVRTGVSYGILIYLIVYGKITAGNFILYFGMAATFASWLSSLSSYIDNISRNCLIISHYREYLEYSDKNNHGEGLAVTHETLPPEIEFRNVSFRYPNCNDYVIKNFSFRINRGENIALVGENGAGKTTLVKLICGLFFPSEGEIIVNGHSSKDFNIDEYYRLFSSVFQDIKLIAVTISDYVGAVDYDAPDKDKVKLCLQKAGLWDKIDSLPCKMDTRLMKGVFDNAIDLSGGEMQKLMLARALYKNSPVLVLDEPTAALDPIAENNLYLKYNELSKNKTSLFISHRLSSTRFCDRIILLEKGELKETGTHDELMNEGGRYAYIFNVQSHYYKEDAVSENAERKS